MKKNYEFTRDLEGAPARSTARLTLDEAAPLLTSGAIVEAKDQDDDTSSADTGATSAAVTANAAVITADSVGKPADAVSAPASAASVTTTRRKRGDS